MTTPRAVDAQRLFVDVRLKPLIEDAAPTTHRCLAVLEGGPGEARARREVQVIVEVRLELLADPRAQRQVRSGAPVVLDVEPGLPVGVINEGIADALRVARRVAGFVLLEARERKGAEVIGAVVALVPPTLDKAAEVNRMPSGSIGPPPLS